MAQIEYHGVMQRGANMRTVASIFDVYDDGPGIVDGEPYVEPYRGNSLLMTFSYDEGALYTALVVREVRDPVYVIDEIHTFDWNIHLLAEFRDLGIRFDVSRGFTGFPNPLRGPDRVEGSFHDDYLCGYAGIDVLRGNEGHDTLDGGTRGDEMVGGSGNDVYHVDNRLDLVVDERGDHDSVLSTVTYWMPYGIEELRLLGSGDLKAFGSIFANDIVGNRGSNRLEGNDGDDRLWGRAGSDRIVGGEGADRMWGGSGRDVFEFRRVSETEDDGVRDRIQDFVPGVDRIDLSAIDADTTSIWSGQSFTRFVSPNRAFTAPCQLKFVNGRLRANTDNDPEAEFSIDLVGVTHLELSDLIL